MPAFNEAAGIEAVLKHTRTMAPAAELLVVDGGSTDATPRLAARHASVLSAPKGRAAQLNAGAQTAQGEWLLFLHADTRLPPGVQETLRQAQRQGAQAGAFRLRIQGQHPLLPLLAWGANLRSALGRIALGDQAPFIQKRLFLALGGFPPLPMMEDYAFALRLKAKRIPWLLAHQKATTCGRRWDTAGFWRTWWLFRTMYRRYHQDPQLLETLRRHYMDLR